MPIWLRNFTFQRIQSYYNEEAEAVKKAQSGKSSTKSITTDGKVTAPEFLKSTKSSPKSKPTYITKMSKK